MRKGIKPRHLLIVGLTATAYSQWLMSNFNLTADFYSVALPRLIQGFGLGLFFVPLSAATYVNIPREKSGNASGIFNLLRNLGGSFGIAFSTTVLTQRAQVHQTFLSENITPYNPAFQEYYERVQNFLHMTHPEIPSQSGGLMFVYQEVMRQASMLSFNDTFYILSIATFSLIPVTFLLRRGKGGPPPDAGMH